MAKEPSFALLNTAAVEVRAARGQQAFAAYWALTKPEVNFLILITTFAGFYLASVREPGSFPVVRVICTLLGTLLVAGGTGALNQFLERSFDVEMRRTARRPITSGRVAPLHALLFGLALSLGGALFLAFSVNVLASVLSVVTLASYLLIYTPLKRKTPLCTLIGAFPGAVPPLIGWAAARGHLDPEAWILYALVFLWQFPHFMAIAWMYRDDYARAGYHVLPRGKWRDQLVNFQSAAIALMLIPVSLIPAITGRSDPSYSIETFVLGSMYFFYSVRFARWKSNTSARQLLTASIAYLPLIFILLILGDQ